MPHPSTRALPLPARERGQAAVLQARRRPRGRWTAAVLAALVVAVTVTIAVQSNRTADNRAVIPPRGATGDDQLLISVGPSDAPAVLTVYEDLRCPGCAQIEGLLHPTINRLQDEGKLRVDYHVLSFVDRIVSGTGSRYAANALAAAHDAGKFREYHDVLYSHPPASETVDTFGDKAVLLDLARKVAGLSTPQFTTAVKEGTHDAWINQVQHRFDQQSRIQGTPALIFNGQDLLKDPAHPLTPERLSELVDKEASAPKSPAAQPSEASEG
ncbi:thioredoxin domain-containing protein [Streptomyces sp. Tue 6075]|uniref:DsbA family protein n=1 Tax=Streptomyces sp. Tue 6075 TaxID=1661694 RepID=UPI00094B6238|nr:thioredoxin domain-containing protein [Streptomyces sp. Tue 6075]